MKFKKKLLLIIPALLIFILIGCKQTISISDNTLINYYAQSINGLSKVMDGYSNSVISGSNYVETPAQKQLKWIQTTQEKLSKDNTGSKKVKYLSGFLDSLQDEIKEYKNNDFNNQKSDANEVGNNRRKLEKVLNVDDSTKVSKAKERINNSSEKLKKAIESQPHIDGKKVINKNGEITFNSVNEIPGFEDDKTVEVKYTYKNTTDEPQAAYEALLSNGDFTQDSGDSINSLEMGIADSDWEDSHPQDQQMYSDGTMTKLKPNESKQYVTYLKVDNFNTPIIFKATDSDTNQEIGKIKLMINE